MIRLGFLIVLVTSPDLQLFRCWLVRYTNRTMICLPTISGLYTYGIMTATVITFKNLIQMSNS